MSSFGFAKSSELKKISGSGATDRDLTSGFWSAEPSRVFGSQSGLSIAFVDGRPVTVDASRERQLHLFYKRLLDVALALAALVFLFPLLVIVAVSIKVTSAGPVLFTQAREGLGGRLFGAYKFRTMWVEAGDATGVAQTVAGDKRVTPLGRFLRRSSIDELPQLLNVLRGDMSLVGPRPHVPGMQAAGRSYRDLVPYYDDRLMMPPGITGWAQANGLRGPTDDAARARARIDHDIAYVQNFSLWLDLKIIALTIKSEFLSGSGS